MKLKQLYWIFFSFVFSCNAQENTTKLNANVFGFCTSNTFTYCDIDDTSFTNRVHKINPQVYFMNSIGERCVIYITI